MKDQTVSFKSPRKSSKLRFATTDRSHAQAWGIAISICPVLNFSYIIQSWKLDLVEFNRYFIDKNNIAINTHNKSILGYSPIGFTLAHNNTHFDCVTVTYCIRVTERYRKRNNKEKSPKLYLCTIFCLQFQVSTSMIIVMMGVQYISQVLVSLFQCIYNRHSLTFYAAWTYITIVNN